MQSDRPRPFLMLWVTHLATTLAQELITISMVVIVFGATGSVFQATGVLVARYLPPLLFGPLVGSMVDRWPRRPLLVITNLIRVAILGLFIWATFQGLSGIWLGYLLILSLTLIEIIHKPAISATLPLVIPIERIVWANSIFFTTTQVVLMVSYLFGGLVLIDIGSNFVVFLSVALLLIAAGSAYLIGPITTPSQTVESRHFWRNIVDGFRYLRQHQLARTLITVEFLESWSHGAWTSVLMLSFTLQALSAGVDAWGYQNSGFFAGQILGALFALSSARYLGKRPGWMIIANGFLMSALTLVYAVSDSVAVAVLISIAFGPPFALRDVAQDALLQTTVATNMLGRIYALREMFARMALLLGGLLFAQLADQIGIRAIYLLSALLYGLTALYTLWSAPRRNSRLEVIPAVR